MNFKDLDETQQAAVKELMSRHMDLNEKKPHYYEEFYFSRWLIARCWNVEEAHEMIIEDKKWREENKVAEFVEKYAEEGNEDREFLERYCPMTLHGVDKRGCPVYVERVGSLDSKGLLSSVELEQLKWHHIYQLEKAEQAKIDTGMALNNTPFRKHYVIEDLTGLSWAHASSTALGLTKALIKLDEAHYPESMKKLFIINAPWIFNAVWKLIKPVLTERTVKKIEICGADYIDVLTEVIDIDQLPSNFGGNSSSVSAGGTVPEAFYKHDAAGSEMGKVHDVLVPRSSVHEVRIPVASGDVLCYEFWTDSYDIGFGVEFASKESPERTPILPSSKVNAHKEHIKGDVTATAEGFFVLLFDNGHSMLRKKSLHYKCILPTQTTMTIEEDDIKE